MTLFIGTPAPDFSGVAVMPDNSVTSDFNLTEYRNGSYCVVFFYSIDHSQICPTELLAINNRIEEFNSRNTAIVAVSVDSHLSHLTWKKREVSSGGLGDIKFPLFSDMTRDISKGYNVLVNESLSLRATFILDRDGIVRYQSVNDFPLGRNINEIIRIIDALQFHENTGDLCPANWIANSPAIKHDDEYAAEFLNDYRNHL